MPTTRSKDGTLIAFEKQGQGPPLLLVDGALCSSWLRADEGNRGAPGATDFTVYIYDRRGRGESGDTAPWALDREVEDIEALLRGAGGSAFVMGLSSGAALSLEAARRGAPIRRLALFEAPFVVDGTYPPIGGRLPADAEIAGRRRTSAAPP